MESAIIDWLSQPDIRRLINTTPPGLICEDKRVLNVLKGRPNLALADFIEDTEGRMRLRNWGAVSEKRFTNDLALFLLRNLRQREGVIVAPTEVTAQDMESYDRVTHLSMDGLRDLYARRHVQWWNLATRNGKADLLMVRIGQQIGFQWPYSSRDLQLSHFRKPNSNQLLRLRGYGKVKLRMVLTALAWAALTDEAPIAPEPMDAWEAYRRANLSPSEKNIIEARYGNTGRHRSATLEDVAQQYGGKTRERIRQIEARAIEKMRLLGLQDAVRQWLYENAEQVWGEICDSEGNVSGFGIGERAPRLLSKDMAWAFRVAEITPYDVLSKIGEMIGKDWYRRAPAPSNQQTT